MASHENLDAVLCAAVRLITHGKYDKPRPAQRELSHQILDAMNEAGGPTPALMQRAVQAPTGLGKALAVDTPIPTPTGWTTMGQLRPGDHVFDERGLPTEVVSVSPVSTDRDCYALSFSDGERIVADGEHLWPSWTRKVRMSMSENRTKNNKRSALASLDRLREIRSMIEVSPFFTTGELCRKFPDAFSTQIIANKRHAMGLEPTKDVPDDMRPVLDALIEQRSVLGGGYELMTTKVMVSTMRSAGGGNHAVALASPLQLSERHLPIDPYVLGAWLGDGSCGSGIVSCGQADIEDMSSLLSDAWPGAIRVSADGSGNYRISLLAPRKDTCPWGHTQRHRVARQSVCTQCSGTSVNDRLNAGEVRWNVGLTSALRDANLLHDKHVPMSYLRAGFDQRLALLQGLMDTDGTSISHHGYEFCVTNEQLALDTHELVTSLGIKATLRQGAAVMTMADGSRRDCGIRYRIVFTTDLQMFRLGRKDAHHRSRPYTRSDSRTGFRYVTGIERVDSVPVRCIAVSSESHLFLAGRHMVPTHNSISYLAPAMLRASEGARTVISTESLTLQDQLVDKDAPVVAKAVEEVTGYLPKTSLLKGWSNYVCRRDAVAHAGSLLGLSDPKISDLPLLGPSMDLAVEFTRRSGKNPSPKSMKKIYASIADGDYAPSIRPTVSMTTRIDDRTYPSADLLALLRWSLSGKSKRDYVGNIGEGLWSLVSTSTSDCSKKQCPFVDSCVPRIMRDRASEADVIVTNHAYLAVQAASSAPVLLGNRSIGKIDHLVEDEAHGIASNVRSFAASDLGRNSWIRMVKAVDRVLEYGALISVGEDLGKALESRIEAFVDGDKQIALEPDQQVFDESFTEQLQSWVSRASRLIPEPEHHWPVKSQRAHLRAKSALESMKLRIKQTGKVDENLARWVDSRYAVLNIAPVDVAPMMAGNLYRVEDEEPSDDAYDDIEPSGADGDDQDKPMRNLAVIAVSATLPTAFSIETGMSVRVQKMDTPFATEFSRSMAYVPLPSPDETRSMLSSRWGREGFDTTLHHRWCLPVVVDLVRANGGSSLVLSATKSDALDFADRLEEADLGVTIYNQFGDLPIADAIAAWKEDTHSVLVGTRSLMTGVDAPGDTNGLVIIDRVPRDATNVLDDARVKSLMSKQDISKWTAINQVYAVAAQVRLEQAVGRLIRTHGDIGAVAVLDPRLHTHWDGKLQYNKATGDIYRQALAPFGLKTGHLQTACDWLAARREDKQ